MKSGSPDEAEILEAREGWRLGVGEDARMGVEVETAEVGSRGEEAVEECWGFGVERGRRGLIENGVQICKDSFDDVLETSVPPALADLEERKRAEFGEVLDDLKEGVDRFGPVIPLEDSFLPSTVPPLFPLDRRDNRHPLGELRLVDLEAPKTVITVAGFRVLAAVVALPIRVEGLVPAVVPRKVPPPPLLPLRADSRDVHLHELRLGPHLDRQFLNRELRVPLEGRPQTLHDRWEPNDLEVAVEQLVRARAELAGDEGEGREALVALDGEGRPGDGPRFKVRGLYVQAEDVEEDLGREWEGGAARVDLNGFRFPPLGLLRRRGEGVGRGFGFTGHGFGQRQRGEGGGEGRTGQIVPKRVR